MTTNFGTLYIVATPIGNLADITFRAIEVLKNVDLIACEDTRVTRKLLDHYSIKTPTVSYFQHSKLSKIEYIIDALKKGKNIALVSDAGVPGISDPGQSLIAQIHRIVIASEAKQSFDLMRDRHVGKLPPRDDNSIKVIPIPGPSALTAAASISGLIEKEFYFAGFLPKKKGRQTLFKKLAGLDVPIVIYDNTLRLERTLTDIKQYLGENTEVFIAREMTKMFEEYWGGSVIDVIAGLQSHKLKGEITLIVKRFP